MLRHALPALALLLTIFAAVPAGAGDRAAGDTAAATSGATAMPSLARSERKEEIVEDDAGAAPQPPRPSEAPAPATTEDFTERDRAAIMRGRAAPASQAISQPQAFTMPELPMSALLYALLAIGIGLHMLGRLKKKATTETVREWSDAVEMPDKPVLEAVPPWVTTPPKADRVPAVQSVRRVRTARLRGDLPPVPAARSGFGRRG